MAPSVSSRRTQNLVYLGEADLTLRAAPDSPYGDPDDGYYQEEAEDLSAERGQTFTLEQARWIIKNLADFKDDDEAPWEDGRVSDALRDNADQLPAELATSAILARYATALAETDPPAAAVPWDIGGNDPRDFAGAGWLLVRVISGGIGRSRHRDEINGPVELQRIRDIMDCARKARDLPVLHQCIDIYAGWLKALADHAVKE